MEPIALTSQNNIKAQRLKFHSIVQQAKYAFLNCNHNLTQSLDTFRFGPLMFLWHYFYVLKMNTTLLITHSFING